ncbi:hypothetical protein PGIGA_G00095000 [Pangasianodon gigas]|uniref:Uncharacterized protein n=1 Tax=Pangasianodon gigas TaxID=30993 RepID=A0ACC5XF46_PANGG|nr:hypothetical protein [Pangasianodon gigas]
MYYLLLSFIGESPTSTSVSVPQRKKKEGREVDEDGCSDLFNPQKRHCSEDGMSNVAGE